MAGVGGGGDGWRVAVEVFGRRVFMAGGVDGWGDGGVFHKPLSINSLAQSQAFPARRHIR